ncbi:MAG: Rieske 2Fe-2S domain-containing protein [Polyangiaceae bacterium]|jgi:salicylate 5-hydroxylase large subunit|nr:Rieske 2Fe-2S domain-containing protein [Polyangiaceae bacterium]
MTHNLSLTELKARAWPEEGLTRVPYFLYDDPDIYAREQERIFRGRSWNYVALAAEVPAKGDFTRSYVGDTPVIVARDKDGDVQVFVNRCPHRGAQLCQSWSGNTKAFTCPYHQWSFDLKGQLRGVPLRKGVRGLGGMPATFDPAQHGLHKLAVVERNGVVFASFAADAPPFEEYLGPSNLAYFERVFDGRKLRVLGKQRQRISANWKHVIENIRDPYHATLLHTFFVTFRLWRADQDYAMKLDESGSNAIQFIQKTAAGPTDVTRETTARHADVRLADPRIVEAVPEFADGKSGAMQTIWPNLIVQQTLNSLATRHAVPHGPTEFELHWTFFGYEDDSPAMVERRLRNANLYGPAGLVSADDSEILNVVQLGSTTSPAAQAFVELGGSGTGDAEGMVNETMIRGFYKHYRQIMDL